LMLFYVEMYERNKMMMMMMMKSVWALLHQRCHDSTCQMPKFLRPN